MLTINDQNIINRYFEIMKQYPELFLPDDAPIRIITNKKYIEKWQKKNQNIDNKIGVLLQDKYITIIRDLVQFSNGSMSGYNRIFNTAVFNQGSSGSVVLPVFDRKILLIKIFRHPIRQWSFEIPRGFGEANLTPIDIVRQEIFEEIGGIIKDVIPLGVIHSNTGLEGNTIHTYLIYISEIGNARKEEGIDQILQIDTSEMESMIAHGKITDGLTISTYTRAKLLGLLN